MKVVLISTYMQPLALGMRYLSSFLKSEGHQVSCLFMSSEKDSEQQLSSTLGDDFVDHCREADVVGFSLMTNSFFRSCSLTEYLRRTGIKAPILWGGTHPTVAPRESAEHADYVCVGEGEKAIIEFLDNIQAGRDPAQTRGFTCLRNGELVCNPVYPLTDDLDQYPFPDYDGDNHWVVRKDRLVAAGPKQIGRILRRYRMSSTRGCPFSCSFCNNATQLNIYREAGFAKHWVRKRSTPSIIAELEAICARYPSIKAVNLIDDLFLIRSEEEVEAFVEAYVSRINLPIEIDAFPNTVTEGKIRILSRLPIDLISMGIQSGSQSVLKDVYNRPTPLAQVAKSIRIISSYGLQAEYHYLVNNPFESEDNLLETLRFVADHHRGPAKTRLFPIQFYPGSAMYHRAREAGFIGERHETAYRGIYHGKKHLKQARYLEIWLRIVLGMRNAGIPSSIVHQVINFAVNPVVRRVLDRRGFAPCAFFLYRLGRVIHRNVIQRLLVRPFRWLTGRLHHKPAEVQTRPEAAKERQAA